MQAGFITCKTALIAALLSVTVIGSAAWAEGPSAGPSSVPSEVSADEPNPSSADAPNTPTPPAARIVVHDSLRHGANGDAAADLALNDADIRMSFDGLETTPLLNVGMVDGGVAGVPGQDITFDTYWNYGHWIERAEIQVSDADDEHAAAPVAILPVDLVTGRVSWTMPAAHQTSRYSYVLRVYDSAGEFDETVDKWIRVVSSETHTPPEPQAISPVDGLDATSRRNIQIRGGAVTISGLGMGDENATQIRVMGRPVELDADGDFAVREILPAGQRKIDINYVRADGMSVEVTRNIDIPETDFFFVALGDLTIGTRSSEGRQLLEASGEEFDETYVTGRGAFYLKGKVQGKYLLTASMDTTEDDIDNLFSNLSNKDPQSLLRRLDPARYYPVYGDDSTYVQDAPTQGRFYVRIERGDDHIVWGNFLTNVTSTEFAQIDRGVYGAKAEYNSDETTTKGERKLKATIFAADPGTIPAREEFRATGGSVYFLQRQDLTIGSERLRIEIRDQDSGLVIETRDLKPFVDYDVDYIQGRVLLSQPLTSTALGDQIVRDGTLSGNNVYLVARYEYVPSLQDIDGYTTGGRIETWLGDHVRVGVTAQDEETGDADQTLISGDIVMRKSDATYLKAEMAQTDGMGFGERASIDGGFTFDPLTAGVGAGEAATAWRVEGAALVSELFASETDAKVSAYYEHLEDGFSGVGRLTQGDTERYGARYTQSFGAKNAVVLKFDDVIIEGGISETTAAADLRIGLTQKLSTGVGVRHNEISSSTIGRDGARTDLGVELRYEAKPGVAVYGFGQGTMDVSGTREDANRGGVGIETSIGESLQLRGEASGGDGGTGALAELTWQRADGEEYYLNYTLDAERQEPGVDGNNFLSNSQNSLTAGGRKRFNDVFSVYGEERATFGDTSGITHAYGLDFKPAKHWSIGASLEVGDLEEQGRVIEREAYTVSAGFADAKKSFGSAFEWREDKENGAFRETWLIRANASVQVSEDWRGLAKFNKAESNGSGGSFFDGEFTEAQIAGAYRPVKNDRLNALLRYTYFEDLPTAAQVSNSGQAGLPAQKSNIFSVDANYRLSHWLTLGGKYGHRHGEVSLTRGSDDFVDSTARLGVVRADVHIVKKWDAVLEGRVLDVDIAGDTKAGALAAIFRHVGNNAKIGVGYNFTDFSDDLTDLSYNDGGAFLNIVAKL